jgi:electron transport complex protein RnfA
MNYFIIVISAIFVNNIILAQFLGVCPFLGVSKKTSTAVGMSGGILFVMTLATLVTWLVQNYVLNPLGLEFMQTITFILVIAALVQMVEIVIKKISPSLYQALGVAILVIQKDFNLMESIVFAISTAIGYGLALIIFSGLREHFDLIGVPKGMRGVPIALITAGILSLAFMGFSGIV